ncbi:hypothetical protein NFI96_008528 [Prochilodus magdalenae]|nr:hypothetical protein NFI96_008528 [Prochilodus magdalenae]
MNMAVEMVLLMVLVSVSLGNSQDGRLELDCRSVGGVIGQTTEISCSFRKNLSEDLIIIAAVTVTKRGERDPVFWIRDGIMKGDPRFKLPSREDPSLQITNTALSDEGLYEYEVVTNRGVIRGRTFRISVTAKYRPPSTSTRPEKIVDGGPAEFHCSASGGYPAGTIHWFDCTGTNWTTRATLEITEGEDKLVHLSSRLSFTKVDSRWGKLRCFVLNSRFITEGETFIGGPDPPLVQKVGSAVAGVLLMGLLIMGLLVLLYHGGYGQRGAPIRTTETDPDPAEADFLSCPQTSCPVLRLPALSSDFLSSVLHAGVEGVYRASKRSYSPTRDVLDMRSEDGNGTESRAWSRLPVQTDIPGIDFHSPGSERKNITHHEPTENNGGGEEGGDEEGYEEGVAGEGEGGGEGGVGVGEGAVGEPGCGDRLLWLDALFAW